MVLRRAVGIAIASIVLVGAMHELQAQPITVTNAAGISVSAMINGIKQPLATTTNVSGQVTIDTSGLNITKGTEVTVWIKTCEDGTVQVILVPAGEEGECTEEGQQAGEDCGCDRAGVIIWGKGPVTIDVGAGTVTQTVAGGGAVGSSYAIGVGFDLLQMLELQNVIEEVDTGATDHDATGWAPGAQVFADWNYNRIFGIGVDVGFSTMDAEIRFPEGLQTVDLNYLEIGANAKLGIPTRGKFWPYVTFGLFRAWNEGDFELNGTSEERKHATRRDGFGAGVDYYGGNWGARFEGLYSSTFEDNDADEHIRWKFGVFYRPGDFSYAAQDRGGLYE